MRLLPRWLCGLKGHKWIKHHSQQYQAARVIFCRKCMTERFPPGIEVCRVYKHDWYDQDPSGMIVGCSCCGISADSNKAYDPYWEQYLY